MRRALVAAILIGVLGNSAASAAEKFYAYNLTTSSDFSGVYLAPPGTDQWGKNQALNDDDKVLNVTERLLLTGVQHALYDVKLVDKAGRTCFKRGADLTHEKTFDIRDGDLTDCK